MPNPGLHATRHAASPAWYSTGGRGRATPSATGGVGEARVGRGGPAPASHGPRARQPRGRLPEPPTTQADRRGGRRPTPTVAALLVGMRGRRRSPRSPGQAPRTPARGRPARPRLHPGRQAYADMAIIGPRMHNPRSGPPSEMLARRMPWPQPPWLQRPPPPLRGGPAPSPARRRSLGRASPAGRAPVGD